MIRRAVGAIVTYNDKFLIVHKVKINTDVGKEDIQGEWDFIKGGVKKDEADLKQTVLRELKEETGSTNYKFIKQFHEKIHFNFPLHLQQKIGYQGQETTMFHLEYLGDLTDLKPIDNEINNIQFIKKENVLNVLTHNETKDFFMKFWDEGSGPLSQ
ncbi:NUDIX hydrolase [Heyndrickxia sp. NPDC080065]|uniref:NUDIX hydrolase n=1 Tax=Heyndrickxia sp. NPDC080065 TaxID=3390568 RepID=UPI003CFE3269